MYLYTRTVCIVYMCLNSPSISYISRMRTNPVLFFIIVANLAPFVSMFPSPAVHYTVDVIPGLKTRSTQVYKHQQAQLLDRLFSYSYTLQFRNCNIKFSELVIGRITRCGEPRSHMWLRARLLRGCQIRLHFQKAIMLKKLNESESKNEMHVRLLTQTESVA